MNLTGKWKYKEDYGFGIAEGELYLKQEGDILSGKIVFTDKLEDEEPYMIQEFLTGRVEDDEIELIAEEYDIIHSDFPIHYELDAWTGNIIDEKTITGFSMDDQGIEGKFEFVRIG